jgi:acetylornithine/succinyldiaminopimelate/putrescine aminotransferase
LSATGQDKFKQGFAPMLDGFIFVPFDDLEAVARAMDQTVCAVLLEPIQGEGGVVLPDEGYLAGLRWLCDENDALLAMDEIQTGLGRTGRLFAYENFDVTPDVMTLAKGLANGLPMGALLATDKAAQAFVPGTHASTFGGGPVIAAAARAALDILGQPEFLAQVRAKGEYLEEKLKLMQQRFRVIREVRGLGLMWGMELAKEGADLVNACRQQGLLVNCTQGNILRLLPPLVVSQAELDRAMDILASSIKAVFS